MNKANLEIRATLKAANIPFWVLADKLGVHENTIIRRMRKELSKADKASFEKAIEEIRAQKETA